MINEWANAVNEDRYAKAAVVAALFVVTLVLKAAVLQWVLLMFRWKFDYWQVLLLYLAVRFILIKTQATFNKKPPEDKKQT